MQAPSVHNQLTLAAHTPLAETGLVGARRPIGLVRWHVATARGCVARANYLALPSSARLGTCYRFGMVCVIRKVSILVRGLHLRQCNCCQAAIVGRLVHVG